MSTLIKWQTRGDYSHAAIQLEDGRIYESWQGFKNGGVRLANIGDGEGIDYFSLEVTYSQYNELVKYLDNQLGKKYDYTGVLRFLSRRKAKEDDKFFCSELVFDALKHVGILLFKETLGWEVSPQMLSRTPLLTRRTAEVVTVEELKEKKTHEQ